MLIFDTEVLNNKILNWHKKNQRQNKEIFMMRLITTLSINYYLQNPLRSAAWRSHVTITLQQPWLYFFVGQAMVAWF
jgi:heptaprenylglyceryl phosphate synthase